MTQLPDALILASASPRRKELLGLLRIPFEVIPSAYDEHLPATHADVPELAAHLASEKAHDVAARFPARLVLGSDTIVTLDERVYGKPADAEDAVRMLLELSGRTHEVVTGVALVRGPELVAAVAITTEVVFRTLDEREIRAYVATGEPMDKAGAYAIQGHGALLIDGIRGDYSNVVGLPVPTVAALLRREGVPILGLTAG
jgi:septum formation protein